MDALQHKARIAKFLFAFRFLDKIIDNEDGTKTKKKYHKNQSTHAKTINKTFQQIQKYEKGTNGISAHTLFLLLKKEGYDINLIYKGNPEEVLANINKKYHKKVLENFARVDRNIEKERKLQAKYRPMLPQLERELAYQTTYKG